MIQTITGTIMLADGTIKKVLLAEYTLYCGDVGHALSLQTTKLVWERHIKFCKICKEQDEITTDGSNARSLVQSVG